MPGLKLTLPLSFTDTTLPTLRDDPRLNAGSLFLADLAHAANPLAAGVPVAGSAVPNIAWKEAAAVLGISSPTSASAPGTLQYSGISGTANSAGKIERTSKGGLHIIMSQAQSLASGVGAVVQNDSMRAFMNANPSHSYYVSTWFNVTRSNPTAGSLTFFEVGRANTGASLAQLNDYPLGWGLTTGSSASSTAGTESATPLAAGSRRVSVALTPGSNLALTGPMNAGPTWGYAASTYNAALNSSRNNRADSFVAYSWHVCDLTLAGLTFAQADAIDAAEYAAQVTATTGRYYGDTIPTAPSTIS